MNAVLMLLSMRQLEQVRVYQGVRGGARKTGFVHKFIK